ncbi:MAG TPA: response regulator transcription factor [Sphingobium sp.]|nr:response regulator transcription factor [Sphingobium sp.]
MTIVSDVVLVGGSSIVREGLRRLLSSQHRHILYTGAKLDEFLLSEMGCPACLLLLIEDQDREWSGTALAEVREQCPAARIAILANKFDFDTMLDAFRAGVEGYLINDLSCERLGGYLDLIALGEKIFPSQLAQQLIDQSAVCEDVPNAVSIDGANLSAREMEILQRLIAGLPNKVISRQLSISEATVKVHVKAVLRKLRVSNRTQAAIWAASQGLHGMAEGDPALPKAAASSAKIDHSGLAAKGSGAAASGYTANA